MAVRETFSPRFAAISGAEQPLPLPGHLRRHICMRFHITMNVIFMKQCFVFHLKLHGYFENVMFLNKRARDAVSF